MDAGTRNSLGREIAGKRIWVAGHGGMVGSAVCRRLAGEPCTVLTVDRRACDLTRQDQVEGVEGQVAQSEAGQQEAVAWRAAPSREISAS